MCSLLLPAMTDAATVGPGHFLKGCRFQPSGQSSEHILCLRREWSHRYAHHRGT